MNATQKACSTLDPVALHIAATTPGQFGAVVEQIIALRSQAVVVGADPMFLNERVKLQALMQSTRLPVAYSLRQHVLEGGSAQLRPTSPSRFATRRSMRTVSCKGPSLQTFRSSSQPSSNWSSTSTLRNHWG